MKTGGVQVRLEAAKRRQNQIEMQEMLDKKDADSKKASVPDLLGIRQGSAFGSKKNSKNEGAVSKNISEHSIVLDQANQRDNSQSLDFQVNDKLLKSNSESDQISQNYQDVTYKESPSKLGFEFMRRPTRKDSQILVKPAVIMNGGETANARKQADEVKEEEEDQETLRKRLTKCCRIKSASFQFHGSKKSTEYDIRSLFIFHGSWRIRKAVVWLIQWKYFDTFIINLIIANSIMLACADYGDRIYGPDYVSVRNNNIGVVDDAFSILFLCECILKIIAMGFILHSNSYMRDRWNWLDIFVVSISVILWLPQLSGNNSVKILRIFRILRPLRSIKQLPTMKKLVKTLIACVFGLFNVILFMLFVFTMFAIFGSHQFAGDQYNACRMTEKPYLVGNNTYEWPINPSAVWLCNVDSDCTRQLGPKAVAKCGNWKDYGMSIENDHPLDNGQIFYNVPKFDNVLWSLIAIYQCVTMEGWTLIKYNYMDANNYWIPQIYFVGLIFVCCFFGMQLVLAQIMETFIQQKLELEKEELEAIEKEQERQEMERQVIEAMVSGDSEKLDSMRERYTMDGKLKKNMPISPIKTRQPNTKVAQEQSETAGQELIKMKTPNPNMISISSLEELEDKNEDQESKKSAYTQEVRLDLLSSEDLFNDKETAYELASRLRSQKNAFYTNLYNFVMNPLYNLIIFLLILGNTITLASDDYPQSFQKEATLLVLNDFFTWAFTFEMLLKMTALGFKNYMRDRFNMFDCIVVIFSLIDFTVSLVQEDSNGSSSFLQVFRALRLLRVIKVVRRWKKLHEIIGKIMLSLNDIMNFSVLLFLFLYIYSLLGMELFANRAFYTDATFNTAVPADQVVEYVASGKTLVSHHYNFDNLYNAMITCFCVIVQEDWNNNMYNFIRGNPDNQFITIAFFIALNASGGYLMLNLFTGILLQNFDSADQKEDPQDQLNKKKEPFNIRKYLSFKFLVQCWFNLLSFFDDRKHKPKVSAPKTNEEVAQPSPYQEANPSLEQQQHEQQQAADNNNQIAVSNSQLAVPNVSDKILKKQKARRGTVLLHYEATDQKATEEEKVVKTTIQEKIKGKSLFIFPEDSKVRIVMGIVAEHRYFERFILLLIAISTVQLAIVTPLDDPNGRKNRIVGYIDYVMTGFFVCEMITKVAAYGFAFCGKNSYIKSPWNILDFVIVVSAIASIIFIDVDLGFIKSLRVLRVLRPLRLIAKNKGLKLAVITIFRSLPPIFNLLLIMWFCLFLISILSLTLFAGQFYRCETGHLSLTQQQIEKGIITRYDCLAYGGEWVQPNDMHFDNILNSFLTHIGIQSTEGWCDIMWLQIQVAGVEYQPIYDSQRYYCLYSIFCILFTTILFLNLFVGVVIETFNTEKEILSLNRLLRAIEKVWIDVQLMNYKARPLVKVQKTGDKIRDLMIGIAQNKYFDNLILLCILANTVILSIVFSGMSDKLDQQLETANLVFTVIFTLEAIIKVIALRKHYFRNAWNNFDFGVVVITWIVQIIVFSKSKIDVKILGTIVRTLRICRIFRLANRAPQLQIILKTVMEALPAVSSLATLMGLLFFLYAIIGMSQFALIINQDQMDDYHVNFSDIGHSLLILMRCTTGEAWDSIMFNLARPYSILNQCNDNPDYYSVQANGGSPDGCGTNISFLYFYSFIVIVIQMFLNLFIAVIIDSYLNQSEAFSLPVNQNDVDEFVDAWQKFDQEGIGSIKADDLESFIMDLALKQTNLINSRKRIRSNPEFRRKFIAGLSIPIHHDLTQFLFYDVLQCLSRAVCEHAYGLERLKEKKLMAFAKKQNQDQGKAQQLKQNLENVFTRDYELDFNDVVTGMTDLDHQIESVDVLRKSVKQITRKPQGKLCKAVDAEEFYTSKHYVYGCLIVDCWREYLKLRSDEQKVAAEHIEAVPSLKKSKTSMPKGDKAQETTLAKRMGSGILGRIEIKNLLSPKALAQPQNELQDASDSVSDSQESQSQSFN